MRYLSRYGVVLTAFFSACSTSPPKIQLRLRADTGTKSITISGLDPAIAGEIARDSSQDEWRALIPVFKMPKDTDLKDYQSPQPGAYRGGWNFHCVYAGYAFCTRANLFFEIL
jgi:hypothetical protein